MGVNDVLNQQHYQTLKQRRKKYGDPWFSEMIFSSRLLTGIRLFTRPLNLNDKALVSEVPVADAKENILEIMNAMPNTKILLVPEMVVSSRQHELIEYDTMLKALAKAQPQLFYYQPLKNRQSSDEHLADRNHLTRVGNRWLGNKIAEELYSYPKLLTP